MDLLPVLPDVSENMPWWNPRYLPALIFAFFAAGFVFLFRFTEFDRFESRLPLVHAQGRVAKLDCNNKGNYLVSYHFDGNTLSSSAGHWRLRQECKQRRQDEVVDVWVSKRDPNYVSFIPQDLAIERMRLGASTFWLLYLFFALPGVIVTRYRIRRDARAAASQPSVRSPASRP